MRGILWRLDTHLRLRVRFEDFLHAIARWLPRRLRQAVITNAAVNARLPDQLAGDRYCGPDGLSYKDLWESA